MARVSLRLSPQKQSVSSHPTRLRALSGENISSDSGRRFRGLPRAEWALPGGGEGRGGVYGRAASVWLTPPYAGKERGLRPSPASGGGATRRGEGTPKVPFSTREAAVPSGVFARLCSPRCHGSFEYAPTSNPALLSLVSRREGGEVPSTPPPRHLSVREPPSLVTRLAHGCGVPTEERDMRQYSTITVNALLTVLTSSTRQLHAPAGPAVPVRVITSSCHRSYVPPLPHLPGSMEGKTLSVASEAGGN